METAYDYDRKGQLPHRDKEGVLDEYQYTYDILGNKTQIKKEYRGLEAESGSCTYGYDLLGRLERVTKDGET